MSILVTQSSMPDLEEYIEEIKPIFTSHRLTNMGPIYKKFQHALIDYLEVSQLSLFVNGHMALELAIQALGLREKQEGEVITTPYTFVSTTHAIARNGLTPVFCDIKADDYTMDPDKIEDLITDKTVAIIPVHVYGNLCDVEAIEKIAQIAFHVNRDTDNIGARRLHTILERLLEDLLFEAPDMQMGEITITEGYVAEKLDSIAQDEDMSRYIL